MLSYESSWLRLFLLLLYYARDVYSCWGYGTEEVVETTAATATPAEKVLKGANTDKYGNPIIPTNPSAYNGWTPSPEIMKTWKNWIQEHQKHRVGNENKTATEIEQAMEELKKAGGFWPPSWQSMKYPLEGENPPPWAYVPKNVGKPSYCLQWPLIGKCSQSLTRWAYDAFEDQCMQFQYSGCGGNQNNYKDKLSCEKACMTVPVSGCDPDTDIRVPEDERYLLDLQLRSKKKKNRGRLYPEDIEQNSESNSRDW